MLKSNYTAYGINNETIKAGTVKYEEGATEDETVSNWCEAVAQDVGEDFEEKVIGIRGK